MAMLDVQHPTATLTPEPGASPRRDHMRFELRIGDDTGVLFTTCARALTTSSSSTPMSAEMAGRGVAGRLVTAAIDYAAERGLVVEALCPFARAWLARHPDVAARATIAWPTQTTEGPRRWATTVSSAAGGDSGVFETRMEHVRPERLVDLAGVADRRGSDSPANRAHDRAEPQRGLVAEQVAVGTGGELDAPTDGRTAIARRPASRATA